MIVIVKVVMIMADMDLFFMIKLLRALSRTFFKNVKVIMWKWKWWCESDDEITPGTLRDFLQKFAGLSWEMQPLSIWCWQCTAQSLGNYKIPHREAAFILIIIILLSST